MQQLIKNSHAHMINVVKSINKEESIEMFIKFTERIIDETGCISESSREV